MAVQVTVATFLLPDFVLFCCKSGWLKMRDVKIRDSQKCRTWKCETWVCGTSLRGWKLRDMKMWDQFAGVENAGKVSMESQSVKVSQSSCIRVQSYSFSTSLFDKWMWNGTILDNRTRLLMKLLPTSSADIIQECCVMFGVKSVSKSIFKRW